VHLIEKFGNKSLRYVNSNPIMFFPQEMDKRHGLRPEMGGEELD
jgi:hypothetical protein